MVTPMVEKLEQITTATEKSIAVSLAAGAIRNVPVKPTATFGVHVHPAPLPFSGCAQATARVQGRGKGFAHGINLVGAPPARAARALEPRQSRPKTGQ